MGRFEPIEKDLTNCCALPTAQTLLIPFMPIPEDEIEITFFKSSGPGGQKKNVTESSVRVRHKPTGIVVVATASRSQHRNKAEALAELERRIIARRRRPKRRVGTKPSRAARARRIEEKKKQGQKKSLRRPPGDD